MFRHASRSRSRQSSLVLRYSACAALLMAAFNFGPAFTVKGSWEGDVAELQNLPKGLEPNSLSGTAFTHNDAVFSIDDGKLTMSYASGPLTVKLSDGKAWTATFSEPDKKVELSGTGLDDMTWKAAKQGTVDGVGDLRVEANSLGEIDAFLQRALPSVGGANIGLDVRSKSDGIQGRLEAQHKLSKDADATYIVENSPGNYALAKLAHKGRLDATVAGGKAVIDLSTESGDNKYNASFARDLDDVLKSPAGIMIGTDNEGVYGSINVNRDVTKDVTGSVQGQGRLRLEGGSAPDVSSVARLSHKLGSLTGSYSTNGGTNVVGLVNVDRDGFNANVQATYTLGQDKPLTYNATLSRELKDVAQSDGVVIIGMDSTDGPYGKLAGRRDLGNGFSGELSTSGRVGALEHSLKVSNDLAYAEVVKSGEEDPRFRLGYQIDVR